jgi:periplasmic protein TonB
MASKSPYLTTGEKVRNFVGWAFVISLVVHAAVAPVFPDLTRHNEDTTVEKVKVEHKVKVKVPTPPPPTPTPPPTPQPNQQQQKSSQQPRLKVNLVKTTNSNNTSSTQQTYVQPKTGTQNGVPAGQGTAAPAKATCATPYADATMRSMVTPEYPQAAKEAGFGDATVLIEVSIGPSGSLVGASVYKSSGNMSIDQAALRAARESTYNPKFVNCTPSSGNYIFHADFVSG